MIIQEFGDNKIVFAYDEWNKNDIDDDNFYVLAYLELYPTRISLKYRNVSIKDYGYGCVGNFVENNIYKKAKFILGRHIDNVDSNLYYSSHVIMDFVAKHIAKYDMVCMPFRKKIFVDRAKDIRAKHIAKCCNKKFSNVYENLINKIADDSCRMDKYEKAFFSVGGKAHYKEFVSRNHTIVPDFYLGKDILKYRAAAIAFMDITRDYSEKKNEISCPVGESQTRMIIPTKWDWRKHMVVNIDHITSGTNKFLDEYPGCVPLKVRLAFNTSRNPSRLFLIAQDSLNNVLKRWNCQLDHPDLAFKILERSSDTQIRKALELLGLSKTRKSDEVSRALAIVYDYDPLDYDCTIVGWTKHSIEAHRRENLRSLEEKLKPYEGTDLSAPDFPVDFSKYGIKQLKTPKEIIMEGHEMQHCVGTYVERALKGSSYIFSFDNGEQRATAEVSQFGKIVQVRGKHNHQNDATTEMQNILGRRIKEAIEKKEYKPPEKFGNIKANEVVFF